MKFKNSIFVNFFDKQKSNFSKNQKKFFFLFNVYILS